MRRSTLWVAMLATAIAGPATAGRFIAASDPTPDDRYIVVFEPDAAPPAAPGRALDAIVALADALAGAHGGTLRRAYAHALRGAVLSLAESEARRLAANPQVAWVEKDGKVAIAASQFGAAWGLDRIDQRDLPLDALYVYRTVAPSVNAYILDTGIRITHLDFAGRAAHGFDFIDNDPDASDCHGHGTHVAGTVGSKTWGVAKRVKLHAVRVLNCAGTGTASQVIAGVDWVTANHVKPAVANMSLLGGASPSVDAAVRASIAAGVTYVVAAGNDGDDACNYSPARVAEALTIGATTQADNGASFTNFGSCVDLFAPGVGITSTWFTSDTATQVLQGTSMASPHVAGAVALYLMQHLQSEPADVFQATVDGSTQDRLGSIGPGSPNRLLHSLFPVNPALLVPAIRLLLD